MGPAGALNPAQTGSDFARGQNLFSFLLLVNPTIIGQAADKAAGARDTVECLYREADRRPLLISAPSANRGSIFDFAYPRTARVFVRYLFFLFFHGLRRL